MYANGGDWIGLVRDGADGGLGILLSTLAGAAAALAVAILLTMYFHTGRRSPRDIVKHGISALVAFGLLAFVAYDTRHAAFAYLGINPSQPTVEFEIRLPPAVLSIIGDTQIELHTDRNQILARVEGAEKAGDGRTVLRGVVAIGYRTTDRVLVLSLPDRAQCEFRLRLAAEPSRTAQFGPWHLADRVALPSNSGAAEIEPRDSFTIRYRVL